MKKVLLIVSFCLIAFIASAQVPPPPHPRCTVCPTYIHTDPNQNFTIVQYNWLQNNGDIMHFIGSDASKVTSWYWEFCYATNIDMTVSVIPNYGTCTMNQFISGYYRVFPDWAPGYVYYNVYAITSCTTKCGLHYAGSVVIEVLPE